MPRPRNWRHRRHLDLGAGVGEPETAAPSDEPTYGGLTAREYCDAIERGEQLTLTGTGRGKLAFVQAVLAEMTARGRTLDLGASIPIPAVIDPRIPPGRAVLVSTANDVDPVTIGVDFGTSKDATVIVPVIWPGGDVVGQAAVSSGDRGLMVEATVFDRVRRHLFDAKAVPVPSVGFRPTPQQRRKLQLETDKAIYGNAYVGPDGQRIDPRTVQAITSTDDPASVIGYRVHADGDERIYDPADVVHERGQPWPADESYHWGAADLERVRGILRKHAPTAAVVDSVADQVRKAADQLGAEPYRPRTWTIHPDLAERFKERLAAFDREYLAGSARSFHDDIAAAAARHWREHVERRRVDIGSSPLRLGDLIETEDTAQRRARIVTVPVERQHLGRDVRDVIDTRLRESVSRHVLARLFREGGVDITGARDSTGTRSPEREKNPAKNSSNPAESGLKPATAEGMKSAALADFIAWCEQLPDGGFRLEPWQQALFNQYLEKR